MSCIDSLLGKLIAAAPTRDEALDRLHAALAGFSTSGIETTVPYLRDLLADPVLREGSMTTTWLAERNREPRPVDV